MSARVTFSLAGPAPMLLVRGLLPRAKRRELVSAQCWPFPEAAASGTSVESDQSERPPPRKGHALHWQHERMLERQMHVQMKPPPRKPPPRLMVVPHAKGVGGRAVATPSQRPPIARRHVIYQPLRQGAGKFNSKRDNGYPWSASAIALCVNQSKSASRGAQGCPAPTRQPPLGCPDRPLGFVATATARVTGADTPAPARPVRKWYPSSCARDRRMEATLSPN